MTMPRITKTIYVVDCTADEHEPTIFQEWKTALEYCNKLKERGLNATIDSYDCCE